MGDFFFAGRLVVLDHGLGLYTLYMHLDRVDVTEGVFIGRGETLGTVGATGRATGPHLHFQVQSQRARVDPATLFALPVSDLTPHPALSPQGRGLESRGLSEVEVAAQHGDRGAADADARRGAARAVHLDLQASRPSHDVALLGGEGRAPRSSGSAPASASHSARGECTEPVTMSSGTP